MGLPVCSRFSCLPAGPPHTDVPPCSHNTPNLSCKGGQAVGKTLVLQLRSNRTMRLKNTLREGLQTRPLYREENQGPGRRENMPGPQGKRVAKGSQWPGSRPEVGAHTWLLPTGVSSPSVSAVHRPTSRSPRDSHFQPSPWTLCSPGLAPWTFLFTPGLSQTQPP